MSYDRPADSVSPGLRTPSDTQGPGTVAGGSGAGRGDYAAALFSREASGPLHVGHKSDKHRLGTTLDGEPINAGHIAADGYFYADKDHDAPLEFQKRPYPKASEFPLKSRVHLVMDMGEQHQFVGGQRDGLWRWYAEVPEIPEGGTPPPPPEITPPPSGPPYVPPPTITPRPPYTPPTRPPTSGNPPPSGGDPVSPVQPPAPPGAPPPVTIPELPSSPRPPSGVPGPPPQTGGGSPGSGGGQTGGGSGDSGGTSPTAPPPTESAPDGSPGGTPMGPEEALGYGEGMTPIWESEIEGLGQMYFNPNAGGGMPSAGAGNSGGNAGGNQPQGQPGGQQGPVMGPPQMPAAPNPMFTWEDYYTGLYGAPKNMSSDPRRTTPSWVEQYGIVYWYNPGNADYRVNPRKGVDYGLNFSAYSAGMVGGGNLGLLNRPHRSSGAGGSMGGTFDAVAADKPLSSSGGDSA